jgi:glyoxylase-like metal-dependent hydrolase (beta-lactamase superfamily II)
VGAYATALDRLGKALTPEITVLVPGHGSVAHGDELAARLEMDRDYVDALQRGEEPVDPRLGPDATYGTDWLPDAHRDNLRQAGITK